MYLQVVFTTHNVAVHAFKDGYYLNYVVHKTAQEATSDQSTLTAVPIQAYIVLYSPEHNSTVYTEAHTNISLH